MTQLILKHLKFLSIIILLIFSNCSIFETNSVDKLIQQMKCRNSSAHSAQEKLVKIGKPSVNSLIESLGDNDDCLRENAAQALGQIGDHQAVEPLIGCLKDERHSVRGDAAVALATIGDSRAILPLIIFLKDEAKNSLESEGDSQYFHNNTRVTIVTAFVNIGKESLYPLIDCLKDTLWDTHSKNADRNVVSSEILKSLNLIYSVAIEALGKIGDNRAIEPLVNCLADKNRYNSSQVADALYNIGQASVNPLIASLRNKDIEIRVNVAWALGKLGDKSAVEPLISCLNESEFGLCDTVAVALGNIGDKSAIPILISHLQYWFNIEKLCSALKKLDWLPKTEEESIYYWIGTRDKLSIDSHWDLAKKILISNAGSKDRKKCLVAVYTLITLGRVELIDDLVTILDKNGNKEMAEMFLYSGSKPLVDAVEKWAPKHGFITYSHFGTMDGVNSWGKW